MPKAKSSSSGSGHRSGNVSSDGSEKPGTEEDYRLKRDRNNIAVKKSREKSRQRARETADRMERLRRENDELEKRTVELARELRTLKDVLLARASGGAARRGGAAAHPKTGTANSSSTEKSSEDAAGMGVVLADPRTVKIDHEYTTPSGSKG